MRSDELAHYGVKGMKWGVRHDYVPKGRRTVGSAKSPTSGGRSQAQNSVTSTKSASADKSSYARSHGRVLVAKGQEAYRTMGLKENHKGHAYVTINKKDAKAYEGWGDYHATYKALEDIIIPSKDERVKTAVELIKNDPEVRMHIAKAQIGFTSGNYKRFADASLEKLAGRPYNTFVSGLDEDKTVRDKYFKALRDKGYNAVEDVMDQGFISDMPLIIFDREKTLSEARYS